MVTEAMAMVITVKMKIANKRNNIENNTERLLAESPTPRAAFFTLTDKKDETKQIYEIGTRLSVIVTPFRMQ